MAKTTDTNGPFRGLYLHWEGKKIYRQSIPTPRIFEPIEKYSHGGDRPNMLIEGDNLQVLASLKPRYAGQVDVIYIDPPYNLGKDDFRYSDRRFHDPDADDSDVDLERSWLSAFLRLGAGQLLRAGEGQSSVSSAQQRRGAHGGSRSQCGGGSGNPVCHLCRTGRRSVWDRSCLCKPFRHSGLRHLYCQGHGWGGAG